VRYIFCSVPSLFCNHFGVARYIYKHAGLPTVVRIERVSEPSPVSYTFSNKWSKAKFGVASSGAE
jgi:hypothetical protein